MATSVIDTGASPQRSKMLVMFAVDVAFIIASTVARYDGSGSTA
jgi:hypothetical protein